MLASPPTSATWPSSTARRADLRKVAIATIIGTTIEWYDFFLYASAAGLVFAELFFKPAGPQVAILLSFATVGVSFLFRPFGGIIAGHLGDKFGRRFMLVWTLVLMGAATTLIGLLPTYETFGIAAPIGLIALRVVQGLATGGEWGGAVLMAVEHAPANKRGLMGTFPQLGVPLGMLLASGILALMTGVVSPGKAFLEWGWRVPFLVSFVLLIIGAVVRRTVDESPVFLAMKRRAKTTKMPATQLFRRHWRLVLGGAFTFAGCTAGGYMITGGFLQSYATQPLSNGGHVGMARTPVLLAVAAGAACWAIFTFLGGYLSDRFGRRTIYIIGWVAFLTTVWALFPLVNTGHVGLFTLGLGLFMIGNGFTYGPQAAYFAELFPTAMRYSGVSITYALGAIVGGAFTPYIATWLVQKTGTSWSVAWYIAAIMALAFVATLALRDTTGVALDADDGAEPAVHAAELSRP